MTQPNPSASEVYVPQKPSKDALARWDHLSNEQLNGAQYALRIIHTSPSIRGRGLDVVKATWAEVCDVLLARTPKQRRTAKALEGK